MGKKSHKILKNSEVSRRRRRKEKHTTMQALSDVFTNSKFAQALVV